MDTPARTMLGALTRIAEISTERRVCTLARASIVAAERLARTLADVVRRVDASDGAPPDTRAAHALLDEFFGPEGW